MLHTSATRIFAAVAITSLSLCLNLYGVTWPYGPGYHYDEPKKVGFVLTGRQDFHHPLLMLEVVRALNAACRFDDEWRIVLLGRGMSAVYGAASVAVTCALGWKVAGFRVGILSAAITASAPIMVVHAHYFKEDMLHTMCCASTLLLYIVFYERPSLSTAMYLGASTGLALAAKYPSVLLVGVFLIWPLMPRCKSDLCSRKSSYYAHLAVVALVSLIIFAIINWRIALDPLQFVRGAHYEATHALKGHTIADHGIYHCFVFHLTKSIAPGMSWLVTLMGLGGWVRGLLEWPLYPWKLRLLLFLSGGYYFLMECSPCKPDPDFMRYMAPLAPLVAIVAAVEIFRLWDATQLSAARYVFATIATAMVMLPLCSSVTFDRCILNDTRDQAKQWLAQGNRQAIWEQLTGTEADIVSMADVDIDTLRGTDIECLVCSAFMYDRYLRGAQLPGQDEAIYAAAGRYRMLFAQHEFVEFTPQCRTMGFNNPVIRIVTAGQKGGHNLAEPSD